MDIFEEFEQMKSELREKWLNYYEINRDWIKISKIHQGQGWVEVIEDKNVSLYCPDSKLIIGFVSALDKRVSKFIYISMQFSGVCNLDKIVQGLGLRFDPDIALKEREKTMQEKEEIQEAKLLTADEEYYSDPLIEELRKEANQSK